MRTPTTTPGYLGLNQALEIILNGKPWKDTNHILADTVDRLLKIRANHFDLEIDKLRANRG